MDNYTIEDRKIISELYVVIGVQNFLYNRFKPNNKNLELMIAILLPFVESLSEESLSETEVNAKKKRIKVWLESRIVEQLLCIN